VINVKEIQLRPQTEEHDLEYKFKNLQRFLEEGDKAKISVMFRGREVVYIESGKKLLNEWIEKIKDLGVVEAPPKLEGKRLSMIIAPAQGAGKKPKPAIATSAKAEPKAKVAEKAEK
jgi:translation initiation factor IF-3